MVDDPHATLDRRLRDAFEPRPCDASRIAREALAIETTRSRRGWLRVAAVVCPAAAVLGLAVSVVFRTPQPSPQVEPEPPTITGSLADGLLIVPLPDGSVSIMGGESRQDRPGEGYGIVLVEGDLR